MDAVWPSLEDVLQAAIRSELARVHVGFAARVVSYARVTQTVTVQPIVRGRHRTAEDISESYILPQITRVPVAFPQGSGGSITWPLANGDTGLCVVMERSHDEWAATGNADCIPQDRRRFDLTDAVFYPGLSSPADPLTEVDPTAMVVAAGALKLGSKTAAQPFVLGTALQTLFNAHTHGTPAGPSGPPTQLMGAPVSPGYPHLSAKITGE